MSDDTKLDLILVPMDGSEPSFRAAGFAVKLAKMSGAEVKLMHAVVNPPYVDYTSAGTMLVHYIEDAKRRAEEWYADIADKASKEGVKLSSETVLDIASAADSIVNYAERNKADLIVMGTRGMTGVKRFLLGSVASGVLAHAKCSVMVVR